MVHKDLANAAKDMAELLGAPRDSVSGHSFWRGGASFAYQAGVPDLVIQRQGDWLSPCYREYILILLWNEGCLPRAICCSVLSSCKHCRWRTACLLSG